MRSSATLFRRLLPLFLLAGLALSSCEHRKSQDPRPKGKCGSGPAAPGGNS